MNAVLITPNSMRPMLEEKCLPDVRLAIKELLRQIVTNKELDRHWHGMERQNIKLIKETRRAERDRKRLEMGSEYHSDEE